jgi:hypothetical protein
MEFQISAIVAMSVMTLVMLMALEMAFLRGQWTQGRVLILKQCRPLSM